MLSKVATASLILLLGIKSGSCDGPPQLDCENSPSAPTSVTQWTSAPYPDPFGTDPPYFSEWPENVNWLNYKTTVANFPIIANSVSLYLVPSPGGQANHSASYFQGDNESSIGNLGTKTSFFVIALAGSSKAGPWLGKIGTVDHTAPYLPRIGDTLEITVSCNPNQCSQDDSLGLMWMPVTDEYLQKCGANGQNAIFLSNAPGQSATFQFKIPSTDPHTGEDITRWADPNISFEVVNFSTHELKYTISIRDISTPWSGPPSQPQPPPAPPPPQDLTEFAIPSPNSKPVGIVTGPDNALWFAMMSGKIGRITTAGAITEFPVPARSPTSIALGSDGALWFADQGDSIGRIMTNGAVTLFRLPAQQPYGIAAGPDSALWFTEFLGNKIGRITTEGAITEFRIPTPNSAPKGIIAGPDGALWFTESSGNKIGRISLAGEVSEFPLPNPFSFPDSITTGADGALWFTEWNQAGLAGRIGRITLAGSITEFRIFVSAVLHPTAITVAPDGIVWFTDTSVGAINVVRMTADAMENFPVVGPPSSFGLTIGPDGALWFTENQGNKIGRLRIRQSAVGLQ